MLRRTVLWLSVATIVLSCPVFADDETPVSYDNYKIVRIYLKSLDQIEQVRTLGLQLMSDIEGPRPTDYIVAPESMAGLDALGIPYVVLNDDVQKSINAERERLAAAPDGGPRDPAWFNDYKTYDQVVAKLNAMHTDRPDLVTVIDVGTTLEGRHIYGVRITGPGSNKPAVLFDGCHHAREWISVMVPMWVADKFVYSYDTDPAIQSLVDRVEFFIIPVVNVDGFVYTWTPNNRLWRKNRRLNSGGCYGVDDNRNYAAGFGGGGSSSDPCDETYHGTAAFSEPETAAMRDFAIAHPQIVSSQSYHSYQQLFMSPYGYTNSLPADNATFMEIDQGSHDRILAVHGMEYDYGPIYTTIYQASGGDTDWYYDHEGIFAFTTELRDTGYYGFELPPAQIIPTCEENFAAATYLADWSASPVKISFPGGLPTRLDPNVPTPVQVKIIAVGATLNTASPRLYTRVGGSGSFSEHTLTSLGGGLFQATLPATICGRTLNYYFTAATTTGVVGQSPADAPTSVYEAVAAPIVTLLDATMNINPGWTTEGLWAWGHPTGEGGQYGEPDPNSGFTGTNVYGYNLSGDYENGLAERNLTTTPINCTGLSNIKLSFYRWLGVEQPSYDHAYVRISNNGTTWNNLWQNTATMEGGQWVYQEFDISSYANNQANVRLRWTMGTTDSSWQFCGWNIDDVKVWAPDPDGCPPVGCAGDGNCDGAVNWRDIDYFVAALTSETAWQNMFLPGTPGCPFDNNDVNDDGAVSWRDIDPLVAAMNTTCP